MEANEIINKRGLMIETVGHQLAPNAYLQVPISLRQRPLGICTHQRPIYSANLLVPSTGSSILVPRVYSVLTVGSAARASRRGPRPKLQRTWHGDR